MLQKSRRISRQNFPGPRSGGFTLQEDHTSLRVVPTQDKESRFSAVISKKVAKISPSRHTWKRRVYEAVAAYEKTHQIKPASYVFFAKKGAAELSFAELSREVESLLGGCSR